MSGARLSASGAPTALNHPSPAVGAAAQQLRAAAAVCAHTSSRSSATLHCVFPMPCRGDYEVRFYLRFLEEQQDAGKQATVARNRRVAYMNRCAMLAGIAFAIGAGSSTAACIGLLQPPEHRGAGPCLRAC